MAERRVKLTDKQYEIYATARRKAQELGSMFQAANAELQSVANLLLDFHQIDAKSQTNVDDKTKEIIVTTEDPKATQKPKAPRAQKGKTAPAAEAEPKKE